MQDFPSAFSFSNEDGWCISGKGFFQPCDRTVHTQGCDQGTQIAALTTAAPRGRRAPLCNVTEAKTSSHQSQTVSGTSLPTSMCPSAREAATLCPARLLIFTLKPHGWTLASGCHTQWVPEPLGSLVEQSPSSNVSKGREE